MCNIGFSSVRDQLEDLSTDVKIVLKQILKKSDGRSWNALIWLRIGLTGSCQHRNQVMSIKMQKIS